MCSIAEGSPILLFTTCTLLLLAAIAMFVLEAINLFYQCAVVVVDNDDCREEPSR